MKIQKLNLEEVLEVLCFWNIKHKPVLMDKKSILYGLADPNIRTITISDDTLKSERVYTLIHELIHSSDINRGYSSGEKETDFRAKETYKEIYKHRFLG
jgi:hypothetical protein